MLLILEFCRVYVFPLLTSSLSFVVLFFALAGPELRKIADTFVNMPTEEFLARLVKSRAPGASIVIVRDSDEKGPEAVSKCRSYVQCC